MKTDNMLAKTDSHFLIYNDKNGKINIDVRFENDNIWLTQSNLVELYQSSKSNVSEHIKHIFEEGELDKISTVRKFRTVASNGKTYDMEYYNLDMIISLGYRIKSHIATRFRIWATDKLHSYIQKGFTINVDRLKNPDNYLLFAQTQARRRIAMTMQDWVDKLHGFLTLNEREILSHIGKISHDLVKQHAENEYDVFHIKQAQIPHNTDFEKFIEEIES